MPGPGSVATSLGTSLAFIMHPTTMPSTTSDGPTAVGVFFNGIPPVLAGDKTTVHTVHPKLIKTAQTDYLKFD